MPVLLKEKVCKCGREAKITSKEHNGMIRGYYCEFCNRPKLKSIITEESRIRGGMAGMRTRWGFENNT